MSVETFAADDLFVVRFKKYLSANPSNAWVNSYELQANIGGSADELLAAATTILNFERQLHAPAVRFAQLIVSTWEEDSKPYDPTVFISSPLSVTGGRTKAQELLPLNQTWAVTRVPAFGRFGHIFYRGCLYEDDVNAPAGKSVFANLSAIVSDLEAAVEDNLLSNLLGGDPSSTLRMVMVNRTGTQVRSVQGLSAGGVSAVPQDHAWYNRTTTP